MFWLYHLGLCGRLSHLWAFWCCARHCHFEFYKRILYLLPKARLVLILGLTFVALPKAFLEVSQPGLINKIISACSLQDQSLEHNTPANMILSSDTSYPHREHNWNCRSIIGMWNYLASSTGPNIAFAGHQCARFTTTPSRLHELSMRCIVRYLKHPRLLLTLFFRSKFELLYWFWLCWNLESFYFWWSFFS